MKSKIKHLVTSGCSFTDNCGERWPHFLAKTFDFKLYNRGHGSAGNDWISMSAIYQVQQLLEQGISSDEIAVVVMWSGINRGSFFINDEFSWIVDSLKASRSPMFVSFHDNQPNIDQLANDKGFLLGSPQCSFVGNDDAKKLKKDYAKNFYCDEWQAISSFNYWLQLQWYCELNNIKLLNLTYKNIFIDGNKDTTSYLHRMVNFDNWWFHNECEGMMEWTKDKDYSFYEDKVHPSIESHEKFVNEVLADLVKTRFEL